MSDQQMPTLFLSHGSPMTALHHSAARDFLESYAAELPRPKAILIASAHFESRQPFVTADEKPEMIYDFGGFPQALFDMKYPAPGSPELAVRAATMLQGAGFEAHPVTGRGFDHGTWVPLKLMYPGADIPVVQLSVQTQKGAAHHLSLGEALRPLRDEGVLIVGSGSLTHNLYELSRRRSDLDAPVLDWVKDFAEWIAEKIEAGDADAIADYKAKAPFAKENHPSEEHFLPLPFAMGAGGGKGKRVHSSYDYGLLSMDAYRFD
ncbi:class III extradiol ring-cleavage dioxygenase [Roseiarcaceae bacterium H3SJ34-1]|uniref:DODA-type extradiol aromatic ring-opening family dioxygenase n=1 Tax=Terripilifer ovatus TaxID=3032367 RepID=UPI003AB9BA39|nr:class III extradiol ring-cleavage dioxygenase [Roseiarcaceae bacterium H3SJ34-1]